MGFDPGKHNFAWAIDGPDGLEDHGVLEGAGEVKRLRYFSGEIDRLVNRFRPDAAGLERYHLRQGKGFVGHMELVNLEIAIVVQICWEYGIPCGLVLPATHKTWHGRHNGAEKRDGSLSMSTVADFAHLGTEHEADAAAVARYFRSHVYGEAA